MADTTDFTGHTNRECGLHRTTGERAWCFDCSEWCYPSEPCVRCALPALREREQVLRGVVQRLAEFDGGDLTVATLARDARTVLRDMEGGGDA